MLFARMQCHPHEWVLELVFPDLFFLMTFEHMYTTAALIYDQLMILRLVNCVRCNTLTSSGYSILILISLYKKK